ncbi:hypothetical protein [Streptomyces sp. NPDC048172]|uniref:hypothetical protein n=1 Tax=Streptomyces sp. NPDC048172 TaxID=3365505 RepID=UPI0037115B76
MLTINLAVLLAVVVVLRLRRRVQARSRGDQQLTVILALILGLLLAPTDFGQGILRATGRVVDQISEIRL